MKAQHNFLATQQWIEISKNYGDTRFLATRVYKERPATSRNIKTSCLQSDVVGRTIKKMLNHPADNRSLGRNHGVSSKFTDHLMHKTYADNSMGKEKYKFRDFSRSVKKFEETLSRRKYTK